FASMAEFRSALISATGSRLNLSETMALDPELCERQRMDGVTRARDFMFNTRWWLFDTIVRSWPPPEVMHAFILLALVVLGLGSLAWYSSVHSLLWAPPPGTA